MAYPLRCPICGRRILRFNRDSEISLEKLNGQLVPRSITVTVECPGCGTLEIQFVATRFLLENHPLKVIAL